jgi:Cd2+/Zn2+-exporting ATPase
VKARRLGPPSSSPASGAHARADGSGQGSRNEARGEMANAQVSTFALKGVGCLDCAKEVEEAIAALPGVEEADFNPVVGRLTLVGEADLEAIQKITKTEGWTLRPQGRTESPNGSPVATVEAPSAEGTPPREVEEPKPWWKQTRQVLLALSASLLLFGLIFEWTGFADRLDGGELLARTLFGASILVGIYIPGRSAWGSLKRKRLTIDTLLVVGTVGAISLGLWEEAASLVVIFSWGEVMEVYASDRARRNVKALMELAPSSAILVRDGEERIMPVESVRAGNLIRIKPGSRVPLDGMVVEGVSAVDEAPITGESMPVDKEEGDEVFAGTMNQQGVLTVRIMAASSETTLAQIIRTVEAARAHKSSYENFGERFGAVYTPAMFVLAALVAALPSLFGQPFEPWFYRALVVLVISCSCGLVLSVPTAALAAISNGARRGLIVKGGAYLEAADRIDVVALDKTGTLSVGQPELTDVVQVSSSPREELLSLAAAVEANSEHPIAAAVVRRARVEGVNIPPSESFSALTGRGATAEVNGERVWVGSPRLAAEEGVLDGNLQALRELESGGKTTIVAWRDGKVVLGVLGIQDPLRQQAAEAVVSLRERGVKRVVMLTGDNERTAEALAKQAGIDEVRAELLPDDKIRVVRELQERGHKVAMVGDGINDGPALAQADLGIAMGVRGTDVARETGDVVLMDDDLMCLSEVLSLGRRATRTIRQNVYLSVGLVAVLVPVALLGWVGLVPGIAINEGSALLVIANGLRLLGSQSELPTTTRSKDGR